MAAPRHGTPLARPPRGFLRRVVDLYAGGFREMTVGRKLWAIILIKLAIMFLVFKLFFFPDPLARDYDNDRDRARAVRNSLTDLNRVHPSENPSKDND
ncbi:MAG: DUF4492 domain-containing protein [Muribaculaceae bacterium]|nr:DUF4492 domain-containing protein [Muribaculaceae bacterium]MDE6360705.1 DUF4492 domain-containing protein [Muribaculaceae bacterium]